VDVEREKHENLCYPVNALTKALAH